MALTGKIASPAPVRGKAEIPGLIPGEKGENGESAYEIAKRNGFEGTEQEWLDSLKGEGGESVYVRYARTADGANFTSGWSEGQNYIGVATGTEAPTDKSRYTWSLFIPQIQRTAYNGNGGAVNVQVANDMVYSVNGYNTVTISLPSDPFYTAHMYVSFPDNGNAVGFEYPDGMLVSGHDPSTAAPGEKWEVNIDSLGGALFARKTVLS